MEKRMKEVQGRFENEKGNLKQQLEKSENEN